MANDNCQKIKQLKLYELLKQETDEFGEDTQMIRQDEHTCIATVDIQKSPTFRGWLFTFGQDMKILAPEPLVKDWKEQIEKLNSIL